MKSNTNCRAGGFTVLELMVSLASASLLMAGVSSSIFIALRATDTSRTPTAYALEGLARLSDMSELQYAQTAAEQTATAVTVTVPDRNDPDTNPETIRYAWSGTPGDPLTRQYNGGAVAPVADDVYLFAIDYYGTNVLPNGNMESGLTGWFAPGSTADLQLFTDEPVAGSSYMWVKNRTSSSAGPHHDVSALLANGAGQTIEVWVKMKDLPEQMTVGIKTQSSGGGAQSFTFQQTAGMSWTKLSGTVTPAWTGSLSSAEFFVDTTPAGSLQEFKVDEAGILRTSYANVSIQIGSDAQSRVETGVSFLNRP